MQEQLKIALDWTPNINHIGFFVAQEKGFYHKNGLSVELITPDQDNYAVTPAKKVELELADFALCPMESIISYQTKKNPFDLVAISSIYQEDLSAIATAINILSPKELDGKIYASYQARYEDGIVQAMVQNAGGKGDFNITYPDKLGIWERVLEGHADATWIFMNWEGVQAKVKNWQLNYFKMSDFEVPYSYSPVIAASAKKVEEKRAIYQRFLAATKQGFLAAKNDPSTVNILAEFVPELDRNIDLSAALTLSISALGDENTWGKMKTENVQTFLDWLRQRGLETADLHVSDLMIDIL